MSNRLLIMCTALAIILTSAVSLTYLNRKAIILKLVTSRDRMDVAPNQTITWQAGPETATEPAQDRPPNIVFILIDDLGINDISTFGGGVAGGLVPTPNIDRLAREGAIFSQAYSGSGTCAPSRAMLLTGRYPTRTGFEFTPTPAGMGRIVSMFANDEARGTLPPLDYNKEAAKTALPYAEQGLPGTEVTLAEVLQAQGYHTVHIGKWHLGQNEESRAISQGFYESLNMENMFYLPKDDPDVVNAELDFDPIDKFLWARAQYATSYNSGDLFEPGGYLTDYWTDEAKKVIEANRNRPFFLYLAHWGVHTPLQATREDYDAVGDIQPHRLRVYAAMVRAIDRSVGEVMDKLEDEGLADNTIIVLSSDNGGAGYIGLPDINQPYRGWKITLFEGGIRVPLFMKWPARIAPGTVVETPVAHIDVMPTLAAAAGTEPPDGIEIDGLDLLPLATGSGEFDRADGALYWQSGYYQVVRAGDWKLQVDGRQKKTWLFNLADDPTEQSDLSQREPEKLAELEALIRKHQEGAVPVLYPYTIETPVAIDKTGAEIAVDGDEYVWWAN
ncbi:sulfatase [Hyphomonas beringensis]|nr:sulfatase [Hyphomonas beringensis]